METVPEANGKEGKEEVVTEGGGGTNGKADVVLDPFVNGHSAKEQGSSFDENEQMIKSLKRQGGWKTCLLVFLSILSVLLFCTVIFVSLDRAKYVGYSNRDCGGAGSSGSYFVPSPPAPAPETDTVLSACSNNGYLFDGETACECFACFSGSTCETYSGDDLCRINVNGGTPEVFVEYWQNHPRKSSVKMSHRIGYGPIKVQQKLKEVIKQVHKLVNNENTDDKFLVFGDGATPLISIAQMAKRSQEGRGTCQISTDAKHECQHAHVWAEKPYYSGYNPVVYPDVIQFVGERSVEDLVNETDVIEFITTPNNPDGALRGRKLVERTAVWDLAYYWPIYTAMTGPYPQESNDMSLWTLSKLTGHASSRVGWAWVKDEGTAKLMQNMACPVGCPLQSQMYAIEALQHLLETEGQIFKWGRTQFEKRWERIQAIFDKTSSFVVRNPLESRPDSYTASESYVATPPYLWFKCTNAQYLAKSSLDKNGQHSLEQLLSDNGMAARPGQYFGAGQEDHARISLYVASVTFDIFIRKMEKMFAQADALLL